MKNLKRLTILMFVMTTIFACKKENQNKDQGSNPPTMEQKVSGEWKMTNWTQDTKGFTGGQQVLTSTGTGKNFSGTIKLNSDKSISSNLSFLVTEYSNYLGLFNDTTTTSYDNEMDGDSWDITSDDNILIFHAETGQYDTLNVVSLTNSKMVLSAALDTSKTIQGVKINVTVNANMTLEK